MSKRKIRKGKAAVAAFAAALPLGLGSAAWAGGWSSDTSAESYDEATAEIYQDSTVDTEQESEANTGLNLVLSAVLGANVTFQESDADVDGGNIGWLPFDSILLDGIDGFCCVDVNSAGNTGGSASNDSSSSNDGDASADATTGSATAGNGANTSVSQSNSGGASASSTNTVTSLDPDGGDAWAASTTSANLYVEQYADVDTYQGAWANTGNNAVVGVVAGINWTEQYASAQTDGGNIGGGGEENYAGNTGGTASNTSASSNLGTASATLTTGSASASNNSTTTVTQSNSGSASATSTNDVHVED